VIEMEIATAIVIVGLAAAAAIEFGLRKA